MYCLDTYALWEIQFENPRYVPFLSKPFVISEWTLVEFYKTMLKTYNKATADYWIRKFTSFVERVDLNILLKAVDFQEEHKKQNISLFDAVGYIFSLNKNFKFVTGDKAFKGMKGVIWVK